MSAAHVPTSNMHRRPNNPFAQRSAQGGSGSRRVSYSGDPRYGPQVTQRHQHSICNPLVILIILGASVYAIYSFTLASPSSAAASTLIETKQGKNASLNPKKKQQPPLSELSPGNADFQDISSLRKHDKNGEERLPYQPALNEEDPEPGPRLERHNADEIDSRDSEAGFNKKPAEPNIEDADNNNNNEDIDNNDPEGESGVINHQPLGDGEDADSIDHDGQQKDVRSEKSATLAKKNRHTRVDEEQLDETAIDSNDPPGDKNDRQPSKKIEDSDSKEIGSRVDKEKSQHATADTIDKDKDMRVDEEKLRAPAEIEADELNDRQSHANGETKNQDSKPGPSPGKGKAGENADKEIDSNELGVGPKQHVPRQKVQEHDKDSLPIATDAEATQGEGKSASNNLMSTGPQLESVSHDSALPNEKNAEAQTKIDLITGAIDTTLVNFTDLLGNTTNNSTYETSSSSNALTLNVSNTSHSGNASDDTEGATLEEITGLNTTLASNHSDARNRDNSDHSKGSKQNLTESSNVTKSEEANSTSTERDLVGAVGISSPTSNSSELATGEKRIGEANLNETLELESNSTEDAKSLPIPLRNTESGNSSTTRKSKGKKSYKSSTTNQGSKKKNGNAVEMVNASERETDVVNTTIAPDDTPSVANEALNGDVQNLTGTNVSGISGIPNHPLPASIPTKENGSPQSKPAVSKAKVGEKLEKAKSKKNLRIGNVTPETNSNRTEKDRKRSSDEALKPRSNEQRKGKEAKISNLTKTRNEKSSSRHTTEPDTTNIVDGGTASKGNKADKSKSKIGKFPFGLSGGKVGTTTISNVTSNALPTEVSNKSKQTEAKEGKKRKGAATNRSKLSSGKGRVGSEKVKKPSSHNSEVKKRRRLRESNQQNFPKLTELYHFVWTTFVLAWYQ